MPHFACVHKEACCQDLVSELTGERPGPINKEREERLEVPCVHLACVKRDPGREVLRAHDSDTMLLYCLSTLCQLAVAARFSSKVDDDGPRMHRCDGLSRYQDRRLPA